MAIAFEDVRDGSMISVTEIEPNIPAVRRPIIRVPPMLVWTIGTTSPNSLSKVE